jgi:hypothetical protein
MDKKIAGLLGAAAALTTVAGVSAQSNALAAPTTYQELLNPVADPVAALKADEARRAGQTASRETDVAQMVYHHHHHHHHHLRRRHHHHHHHHHQYMG